MAPRISGRVWMATTTTLPSTRVPRNAASKAAGTPAASTEACAPRPPVRSLIADTTSHSRGSSSCLTPSPRSTARRAGEGSDDDHIHAASAQGEIDADADGAAAMDDRGLAGLKLAALGGAPGDGHGLDQRALHAGHAGGQLVRHRALDHRVLGQAAAVAVVAMEGQQAAMVVLAAFAVQAVPAGLHRFHGDPVADGEILDAGADLHDITAQLVSHDHGIDHAR